MKKTMWAFALLLCAIAWTHAADSFEVNLSTIGTKGYLVFQDKGDCTFESSKQFFNKNTGKCPKGAVIKVEARTQFGDLLKLKCWQNSDACVSTDDVLELVVSSDTTLSAVFDKKDIDLSMDISKYSGSFQFPVF